MTQRQYVINTKRMTMNNSDVLKIKEKRLMFIYLFLSYANYYYVG